MSSSFRQRDGQFGMNGCAYEVDAYEGAWNSGKTYEDGNKAIAGRQGGYFPCLRSTRSKTFAPPCRWLRGNGIEVRSSPP